MRRNGFTLLELVVAITLTGVIALLVYGAARAAVDTEQRLQERRRAIRSDVAWQALLVDALRNVRSPLDHAEPTLRVEPGIDGTGRPRDRLAFITAGGTPPLTGDSDWAVSIELTGVGLMMMAVPVGVDAPARAVVGKTGVTGLQVRAARGLPGDGWLESWVSPRELPVALELTFWTDSGPAGPPLIVGLPVGVGARGGRPGR